MHTHMLMPGGLGKLQRVCSPRQRKLEKKKQEDGEGKKLERNDGTNNMEGRQKMFEGKFFSLIKKLILPFSIISYLVDQEIQSRIKCCSNRITSINGNKKKFSPLQT